MQPVLKQIEGEESGSGAKLALRMVTFFVHHDVLIFKLLVHCNVHNYKFLGYACAFLSFRATRRFKSIGAAQESSVEVEIKLISGFD